MTPYHQFLWYVVFTAVAITAVAIAVSFAVFLLFILVQVMRGKL